MINPAISDGKYKVLILTDHANHSVENSLYELSVKMLIHPKTESVDIASRGNEKNHGFFFNKEGEKLFTTKIDEDFAFDVINNPLDQNTENHNLQDYDLVWLRLPPPLDKTFLNFISEIFKNQFVINRPQAILETGSKEFLLNFESLCPPMKICTTIDEIVILKKQFPIVLKPLREYGGKGLIRVDNERVWKGNKEMSFQSFVGELVDGEFEYLAVKFLNNFKKGDKRIIVVNGSVLGASLRLPPEDSWICNVAMGGTSHISDLTQEEKILIENINPLLSEKGIVMYGVDTLVNDDGLRVLSELNTTSIGGLPQIAKLQNKPLVEEAINLIWDYYETHKIN